ncbi:MAG: DUF4214 domain-containing protein [Clostridia bacterium]|nr:DUF4214 domain-containing protein [Clostridia bacterium]
MLKKFVAWVLVMITAFTMLSVTGTKVSADESLDGKGGKVPITKKQIDKGRDLRFCPDESGTYYISFKDVTGSGQPCLNEVLDSNYKEVNVEKFKEGWGANYYARVNLTGGEIYWFIPGYSGVDDDQDIAYTFCVKKAELPTDIHLTVETKKIYIEDIGDDRQVTLSAYIENCEPFDTMSVYVTKDSRLDFCPSDPYKGDFSEPGEGIQNVQAVSCGWFSDDSAYRVVDIISYIGDENLIEIVGDEFFTMKFTLPADVKPGDFYKVELPKQVKGNSVQINFSNSREDSYLGDVCFTQLNSGGILIASKEMEASSNTQGNNTDVSTPTTSPTTAVPSSELKFDDFVERLYVVALNRQSEPEGKAFWCEHVGNGDLNGAQCANEFLLSKEFNDRGLSDQEFLYVLYKTFFDRESKDDPEGFNFWLNSLKTEGRDKVVDGFINSEEWCNICASYGVKSGATRAKATIASANATAFATRLYTECLGRDPEAEGLKFWSLGLTNLEFSGTQAAREFFYSSEFVNANYSDEEYINRMYKTFMGRDPEPEGKAYWLDLLSKGTSRDEVFNFFSTCPEFTGICNEYAITR